MDYYGILGVLPTADECVIRTAHRVLAQKYRPGRTRTSSPEAEARFAQIEEAFRVLSEPAARAEYDEQRTEEDAGTREYGEQEAYEDLLEEPGWRTDWDLASRFYPQLKEIEAQFSAISPPLAFTFCAFLLETKRFPEAADIAREMELTYLGRYFGEDPDILAFAKQLILHGNIDAVRTLGHALRVLGSSTPAQVIIETLSRDLPQEGGNHPQSEPELTPPETAETPDSDVAAEEGEKSAPTLASSGELGAEQNAPVQAPEAARQSQPAPEPDNAAALLKSSPRPAPKERDSGGKGPARDPKTRAAVQEFLRMYRANGCLDVDSAVVLVRALGGTVDLKKAGTFFGEAGIEVGFRGQRINFGPDDFLQWAERKLLPEALTQR